MDMFKFQWEDFFWQEHKYLCIYIALHYHNNIFSHHLIGVWPVIEAVEYTDCFSAEG